MSCQIHKPPSLCLFGALTSTYKHAVEEIKIVHRGELFAVLFCGGGEVRFCVWGCDDGEGAAQGGFDFGVEVVAGRKGG